jgi:hypothetical protein
MSIHALTCMHLHTCKNMYECVHAHMHMHEHTHPHKHKIRSEHILTAVQDFLLYNTDFKNITIIMISNEY